MKGRLPLSKLGGRLPLSKLGGETLKDQISVVPINGREAINVDVTPDEK